MQIIRQFEVITVHGEPTAPADDPEAAPDVLIIARHNDCDRVEIRAESWEEAAFLASNPQLTITLSVG